MSNISGRAKVKIAKNEKNPPLFTSKQLIKFYKILRNTTQVIVRHRICLQTGGQTNGHGETSILPYNFVAGGMIIVKFRDTCNSPRRVLDSSFVAWDLPIFTQNNTVRWEVIVRFVDIGGIVDHDCLNFLFIIVGLVNFLLGLIKFYPTGISVVHRPSLIIVATIFVNPCLLLLFLPD
jgi:hypothetical protein